MFIQDLKCVLLCCSMLSVLKITDIQAVSKNILSGSSNFDSAFFYPDEENPRQLRNVNNLEVYSKKNTWAKPVKEDNRPVAKLAAKLHSFHQNLTSVIFNSKPGKNIIYSPISVTSLLAMMAIAARAKTAKEILVNSGLSIDFVTMSGFKHLMNIFERADGVKLKLANQIFTSESVEIEPTFQKNILQSFHSTIKAINFYNQYDAAETINEWCRKHTNNMISNIVTPEDLQDALMVLTNAIYFQGNWEMPFNAEMTENSPFHVDRTKTVNVPMMYINEEFNWGRIRELNAKFIELPYRRKQGTEDTFSMYLIVPNQVDGLNLIERNFHDIDFKRLNNIEGDVHLWLPKFKIQNKLDLEPILKKMGIYRIFDPTYADFRGMVTMANDVNLHVSKMTQKAFLKVDEMGSTAAAITGSTFHDRKMPSQIRADRPFVCAIIIKSVGIPLFYARVADPTKFE